MIPLVSQAPRPQIHSPSSRDAIERRNRVDVGRERDHGLIPGGENVEPVRLHFHALHSSAGPVRHARKMLEQVHAHLFFVGSD